MNDKINTLFTSCEGANILKSAEEAINDCGMLEKIKRGVVLGLSGGADSVMLLFVLLKLKKEYGEYPITCVHVNHMIRGDAADADELFCKRLCSQLDVPFTAHRVDIPLMAEQRKMGVEEVARNVRYELFGEKIKELNSDACIAVAHNSTDNLETIIFNMMRGAGISGLAGIRPIRDNIIRPLIYSSKSEISSALDKCGIEYVTDETNLSCDYSRNYIRNVILPALTPLAVSPEKMGLRISKNLIDDKELIDKYTDIFINENLVGGSIQTKTLLDTPKALFYRILAEMMRQKCDKTLERTHVDRIYSLLSSGDFSYSLPSDMTFVSSGGISYITEKNEYELDGGIIPCPLAQGVNHLQGYDSVIILSDKPDFECYSNVYKISIQATLPSDIISDELYVRQKRDGDAYAYGGITRKLKKLFNDKKIPMSERASVPVVCDKYGIVWVAGFGVRNEEENKKLSYIAIGEPIEECTGKKLFVCSRKKDNKEIPRKARIKLNESKV